MRNLLLGLMMLFALSVFAQNTHTINFETPGVGADWASTMTENADNPPVEFIANPVSGGINTSTTVAKFTARAAGNPWALCFTDGDGVFTFDASNSTVKIMVYKPVISNVGLKFEGFSAPIEIQIPNTLINQWEELTFNFSASIGNTYSRIVIIPDFAARSEDHVIYLDNIQVPNGVPVGPLPEPTTVPPTPTHAAENVISIFSDSYTNIPGTNFNPNWGQSTIVTVNYIAAGNNTLKYENLNYQGTQYTNQNVSLFQYFHIDFWTPNATNLSFFLISPGPVETPYALAITPESWVSIDIPLSAFAPVNLSDIFQFKVVGNGTVYFDNWYFWKNPSNPGTDATLSDLKVNGTTINGFTPGTLNYNYELPSGSPVPTVTATTNDPLASFVVNNAVSLPGTSQVVVTAQDGITTLSYNVNFTLVPSVAAPTPTQNPLNVISMYSNAFTNVPVDTWLTAWSQGVLEDVIIAGNPTKKYSLLNFVGIETTGANLINATEMTHFHIDVWSPDANDFKIKLVDFGADASYGGGDDTEHELTYPAPATNTWISYDIPLSNFTGLASREHLAQLIMVKAPLGTIYVDNVFYYFLGPKPYLALDVQDNFENNGWGTIPVWTFQDPNLVPLPVVADPVIPTNNVASYNRSGAFQWTNAQFILNHRMDLTSRNIFNLKVYFPSSNDYTGALTPTAAIKLQNSLLGGNAWTTQEQILITVTEFDQWITLSFDFEYASTRDDFDQVVVQFGGEGHNTPGIFYFDDLQLMGYSVSGNVYYGITGNTKPMATNTSVILYPGPTVPTSTGGAYLVRPVANGSYKLSGATTKEWGGLQAFDATLVARYLGSIITLTDLQKRASDVNLSSTITAFDGTLIKRRLGSIATPQWTAPTYVFDGPFPTTPVLDGIPLTVSGANVTQELRTLCSGDVNGSYSPPVE
jgi:hypothetical protein